MATLNRVTEPEFPYDFAVGRSSPATLPVKALQDAAVRAIAEDYEELARYPGDLGHEGLRTVLARRESEREGVAVDPDSIAITNGSMQAVSLVAETLTQPGDAIVAEEVTYYGTVTAYRTLGIDIHGVPLDEDGMRIDLLEQKLDALGESKKPKFIYTLTTYHNPTGTLLSNERRLRLIDLARERDLVIFEDNCYGDVHFIGEKPPSLYALSDYDKIVYACSLSKILAPGLRLGYVMAKEPLLEQLMTRRLDEGTSSLSASIVAQLYKDDIWEITGNLNRPMHVKRDILLRGLKKELSDLCMWSEPVGGMFVWVRFPSDVDQEKLEALCLENGVRFTAGSRFHVEGKSIPYLRLAFAHVSDSAIEEGIPIFASCLRKSRTSNAEREFTSLYS